ncbi:MAG: hypothetical protein AAFX79_09045 [Planctomycetota bacterium]
MFAQDRDVLYLEPHAFTDALWAGRRLASGIATVSGTTLVASSVDAGFDVAGAAAGGVIVFNGVPYEITAVASATELGLSRLRASVDDASLPPAPASNASFTLVSFAPQIALVHAQIMAMLGLDDPEGPGEAAVVAESAGALANVEALGALHLVYASASALAGPSSAIGARAVMYREMFSRAQRVLAVRLDVDGDGIADATRRPGVVQLVRG